MADDLVDTIKEAAAAPQTVVADGVQVTARPIGELIAADKYAKSAAAGKKKARGIGFIKLLPEATS